MVIDLIIAAAIKLLQCYVKKNLIKKVTQSFIVETPIPKAQRSGIGKLNNPAKRRV
jgi:hypothetical protein